jgi:hypothetical protein
MAVVALVETVGFCALDVKLFGPVQLYEAPLTVEAVRDSVEPTLTGPLLLAARVAGGEPQLLCLT